MSLVEQVIQRANELRRLSNQLLDEPIAALSDDSLLDLIEMGYRLGRHGAYNDVLVTKRRELLKDHLEAFKKTR